MSGKKKAEARLKEIGLPPKSLGGDTYIQKWDNSLKKFTAAIEQQYNENRQSKSEFQKKLKLLEEIESYLEKNV